MIWLTLLAVPAALAALDYAARARWWRLGPWTLRLFPGREGCLSCRTSFRYARPHVTTFRVVAINGELRRAGLHPLCERCWSSMTPTRRLPFYQEAWLAQVDVFKSLGLTPPNATLNEIRVAVAAGA